MVNRRFPRQSPRVIRWCGIAVAAALAVGTAGCSKDSPTITVDGAATDFPAMDTPAQLAAAGQKSAQVTSGRFAFDAEIATGSGFGESTGGGDSGATDEPSRTITWSTTGEFNGTTTHFGSSDGPLFGDISDVTEITRDGDRLYLRDPSGWGVIDMGRLADGPAGRRGILESLSTLGSDWSQVSKAFTVLGSAADRIDDAGTDELHGTVTVHRRFSVDPAAFVSVFASMIGFDISADQSTTGPAANVIRGILGDQPVEVDGWFDAEGIVRKLKYSFDSQLFSARQTLELWDPGSDVEVQVPSDARTLSLSDLVGR